MLDEVVYFISILNVNVDFLNNLINIILSVRIKANLYSIVLLIITLKIYHYEKPVKEIIFCEWAIPLTNLKNSKTIF